MRRVLILLAGLLAPVAHSQSGNTPPQQANQSQADQFFEQGISAQQRGDMQAAIDSYRKALAINPGLMPARANLGVALANAGQLDAAIEEDQRVLKEAPSQVGVRMNLALAYYKQGDCGRALPELDAVHTARPSDLRAAMLLGYCESKGNRAAEAAALLLPFEPGHENDMDFEYALAYALMQSGREPEGLPRMEKVARATRSVDAWVIAGQARLHRREFELAKTDLDAAMELNPDFPGLPTLAGQARDAQGDVERAQTAFDAALKQNPQDAMANLYLGAMHLKKREFEQARPLLERALTSQPDLREARFQMAKLDGMTDRYAEAAAALEVLEKEDPGWLDPHVELAAIYYKLHRPDDGKHERDIVQQLEARQQQAGPPAQVVPPAQ
jgi:tetratricopeptide (TPR) repeat protein